MIGALICFVVAFAAWTYVFCPPRRGIWVRTRISATAMIVAAGAVLLADDRLGEAFGSVDARTVVLGVGVGVGWLIATQIGVRVIALVIPSIIDRAGELYEIAAGDRRRDIAIAVVSMALAEEMVFRGVIQLEWGLFAGIVGYTVVQVVERNWALVLAGLACGTVFGVLAEWTDGLTAPLIAHLIWTGSLTFVWPLKDPSGVPVPAADDVTIGN